MALSKKNRFLIILFAVLLLIFAVYSFKSRNSNDTATDQILNGSDTATEVPNYGKSTSKTGTEAESTGSTQNSNEPAVMDFGSGPALNTAKDSADKNIEVPEIFRSVPEEDYEDLTPPCPTKAESYKDVMNCPKIPASVKAILKKLNSREVRDECIFESKTRNITLGPRYIAWSLHLSNSCEGKVFPDGLPIEQTYQMIDGKEVVFEDLLDIMEIETLYRAHVNLGGGLDQKDRNCTPVPVKNRVIKLGALDSQLTKANFRFVDNSKVVTLRMMSYFQQKNGVVCRLPAKIVKWKPFEKVRLPDE